MDGLSAFERGIRYLRKGDFDDALKELSVAIEEDLTDWRAHINRAHALCRLKQFDMALRDCDNALRYFMPIASKGGPIIYRPLEEWDESDFKFIKMNLDLAQKLAGILDTRGTVYCSQCQHDKAIQDYEKAFELIQTAEVLFKLGKLNLKMEKWESAVNNYSMIIQHFPKWSSDAFYCRGLALKKLKHYEEALNDFHECLKSAENDHEAWFEKGICNYLLSRYNDAYADFSKAISLNHDYAEAFSCRGAISCDIYKNFDEALKDFNRALDLKDKVSDYVVAEFYFNRGCVYHATNDYDQALRDYSNSINTHSAYLESYFKRSEVLLCLGDYEKALDNINSAIELNPSKSGFYLLRARIYEELGNKAKAEEDIVKAKKIKIDLEAGNGND